MTENMNNGCSQRDSAEHEGYAKASRSFNRIWKERDSAQPKLLEAILYKDNFNRAYKRVRANKGAAGIDGMIIKPSLEKIKVYARGWLNYYGIASMKNNIDDINGWLYRRIRMCIWKQWKKPRTRMKNLIKLGVAEHYAATIAYSR
uniref:group II intron maturase-specific domain-containing protein n=1 Tax=Acetatifactor sp. TaxID=1872090 RepID=UPI004057928A